jgi:hypothetical protein
MTKGHIMRILRRAVVATMVPVAAVALSAPTALAQAAPTDPGQPKLEVKLSCEGDTVIITCRLPDGGFTSVSTPRPGIPVTKGDTTKSCSNGLQRGVNIKAGVSAEGVCTAAP